MKIGIDISQSVHHGTGVSTYTRNLVKHLLEIDSSNTYVLFGTSFRKYTYLFSSTHKLHASKRFFPIPPTLTEIMFNRSDFVPIEVLIGLVDVFHASDWTQPSSLKARLVTTVHDLTVIKYPEHQHPKTVATHMRRLKKIQQNQVMVVADSLATKKDLIKLLNYDPDLVEVVHLAAGQDFSQFAATERVKRSKLIKKIRQKYDLPEQYILSVGTAEPRKNLAQTIKAFLQVHQNQFHNLDLVIAGKYGWGTDERQLDPQLKNKILLLGYVDQADLPALYAGAKAFVYPSLYEGFGLPVLESMTVGTPVVTSNRGSLAEVAGTAAVVVNPQSVVSIADGLVEALTNSRDYRALGLRQAKQFSWQKTAEKTLQIYEKVSTHQ